MTTIETILAIFSIALIATGSWPMLRKNHSHRINLSAWTVIVCNAWLGALGMVFSEKTGFGAIYLVLNALLLTPILLLNIKKGAWEGLPNWQKLAAPILPLGAILGILLGGQYATWSACVVSCLLSAQLIESVWKKLSKESLTAWILFLISDLTALTVGWSTSNYAYRVLLSLWVLQCLGVILISLKNRLNKNMSSLYVSISGRII